MPKMDIMSLNFSELRDEILKINMPSFRAKQIYSWLHQKLVSSFDEMSNLSKADRERLNEYYYITTPKIKRKLVSKIDGTVKYLFELADGECIETVLMKYKHGNTVCVSTQVGCRMGCDFCASTIAGFRRNLTSAEILSEIYMAQKDSGERVSNIVLMGIGEPLDNYDNVIRFLSQISDENGLNISLRHISLSTCG
ncbi:MAG: radical SAM protein, partial [Oscillospiraceae bacterium]|nr:radical SAM protein [Oscillospiraceae bacterium]